MMMAYSVVADDNDDQNSKQQKLCESVYVWTYERSFGFFFCRYVWVLYVCIYATKSKYTNWEGGKMMMMIKFIVGTVHTEKRTECKCSKETRTHGICSISETL